MTAMMTIKTWQDSYLELMARIEEPVVDLTAMAAEVIAEYIPERPNWAFLEGAPTMTEFVDNQLKFRRRVVDEQAAFVHKLMKAMKPALVRLETVPAAVPPPTANAGVKRQAAKRTSARRAPVRRTVHAA
jgi:hypothetical protein